VSDLAVHKFGIFRFRTSISSAPNTPSSSHRLRPSMLHLDTLSRNLFGAGSVSSRDRSSTISSNRSKSNDSRTSGESKRSDLLLSPGPYKMLAAGSEVDLNERLNLARKNSNIAAYSPAKPPRSPLNGLLPVNTLMPVRADSPARSPGPRFNSTPTPIASDDTPAVSRKTIEDDPAGHLREASELISLNALMISTMWLASRGTHCSSADSQQDTFPCPYRCSVIASTEWTQVPRWAKRAGQHVDSTTFPYSLTSHTTSRHPDSSNDNECPVTNECHTVIICADHSCQVSWSGIKSYPPSTGLWWW
jgi:hypothetical protein